MNCWGHLSIGLLFIGYNFLDMLLVEVTISSQLEEKTAAKILLIDAARKRDRVSIVYALSRSNPHIEVHWVEFTTKNLAAKDKTTKSVL
jgi:hypothetical protein